MRAETPRLVRRRAIAGALIAFALVACRTSNSRGRIDPGPELKAVVGRAETAEIAALPDGAPKALLTERCLMCHGAALITQQRKDAAAWGRTVAQMRTWGTPIQDEDQAALVAYLTEQFGPSRGRR